VRIHARNDESSGKARPDHVDLRVCNRPAMSVHANKPRGDFVITR
jgi:hypothetical protein